MHLEIQDWPVLLLVNHDSSTVFVVFLPVVMAGSDHIAEDTTASPEPTKTSPEVMADKHDISQVERVMSGGSDIKKDFMNYDRVDKDVAKYAANEHIEISQEENKRLKRMIDRRVLAIMILTYFLQALDKGTMSFASIMGIREDLNLHAQQVSKSIHCFQ